MNDAKYTLINPEGQIIDVRWGGMPAMVAKRDRLNKTWPGHRLLVNFGSDPVRVV